MSVYVVAQISITNPASYAKYLAKFKEVFDKFNGKLLVADPDPIAIEGELEYEKLILMSFPDETSFSDWAQSPEYIAISKDRKAGSEGSVVLVKSV